MKFTTPAMITISVNEYIEKFSEIKPHIDQALENINVTEIYIQNDGCKDKLIRKMMKYIINHDCKATTNLLF